MFFNISPRFYASAMIGIQFYGDFMLKETFDYKNELYKEHLPIFSNQGNTTFNFDQNLTLGLHYRF